jgi:hypothetical protein
LILPSILYLSSPVCWYLSVFSNVPIFTSAERGLCNENFLIMVRYSSKSNTVWRVHNFKRWKSIPLKFVNMTPYSLTTTDWLPKMHSVTTFHWRHYLFSGLLVDGRTFSFSHILLIGDLLHTWLPTYTHRAVADTVTDSVAKIKVRILHVFFVKWSISRHLEIINIAIFVLLLFYNPTSPVYYKWGNIDFSNLKNWLGTCW